MLLIERLLSFATRVAIAGFLAHVAEVTFTRSGSSNLPIEQCHSQESFSDATMDSTNIIQSLNISDPKWRSPIKYFGNSQFENKFQQLKNTKETPPLKIILVPHSHNDPEWRMIMEEYFQERTKHVLENAMVKLIQHKNLTFIWNEASVLKTWWKSALPTQKQAFKKLLKEGRLEITTGGWVTADDAVNSLYAQPDQLIEGQHWFKVHLEILPTTSWSIGSFSLGPTFPYLLRGSGINSMIFMRIHYVWKDCWATTQKGDFNWVHRWDSEQKFSILSHQVLHRMFDTENTLGPHPMINEILNFFHSTGSINEHTIASRAKLLLEGAGRTASLFEHNVALVPVPKNYFAFLNKIHWDSVYSNYMKLIEFINSNKAMHNNAEISFGTPSDYFKVKLLLIVNFV